MFTEKNNQNQHWIVVILSKIMQGFHTIKEYVVRCIKCIWEFIKKRWKILVGVLAGFALVCVGIGVYFELTETILPRKHQNDAVDRIESKLHSDNPEIKLQCAYEILQDKHSENKGEFNYYEDFSFLIVKERFHSLMQDAFNYIRDNAFAGDARCQYYLGILYYFEDNWVENDETKAAYWWNEAALQGFVRAYNNIGICYKDGKGVNKDLKLAVEWLKKGAEAGESQAQYNYGNLFLEGVKIQIGSHKKLKPGYNPNYYNKYDLYAWEDVPDYEILIKTDIDKAKYWWQKSAEQGNSSAINALQKIYN